MGSRFINLFIFGFAFLVAVACLGYRAQSISSEWSELYLRDDFNHYYATSWIMRHHGSPYGVSFADTELAKKFIWQESIPKPTNPPLLMMLTSPLSLASPQSSWNTWIAIVVLAAILSVGIIVWELRFLLPGSVLGLLLICFLASSSFFTLLTHAQIQSILLLLTIVGWAFYRRGQLFAPAFLWALATAIKFYTWPLLLVLLLKKREAFVFSCIFLALFLSLPCLVFGASIYLDFLHFGLPGIQSAATELGHNMSLGRSIFSFASYFWPEVEFSRVGKALCFTALPLCVVVACLGVLNEKNNRDGTQRTSDFLVTFALFIGFVSAPVAWPNYLLAMMLPMAVLVAYRIDRPIVLLATYLIWMLVFQNPHPESAYTLIPEPYFYPASRAFVAVGSLLLFVLLLSDSDKIPSQNE